MRALLWSAHALRRVEPTPAAQVISLPDEATKREVTGGYGNTNPIRHVHRREGGNRSLSTFVGTDGQPSPQFTFVFTKNLFDTPAGMHGRS